MDICDFIVERRAHRTLKRTSGNFAASVSNLSSLDPERCSTNSQKTPDLRARSTSMTSLAEPSPTADLTFFIARSTDPSTRLLLRAASNSETENWISTLRQAQMDYENAVEKYKFEQSRDQNPQVSSFVAALSVFVISASDLMLLGDDKKETPSPFCNVSVCLRSRKTNVVLFRRSPTWNIGWKFPIGDVNRDVDLEVAKFLNLAPDVDPEYPVMFNIIFWLTVTLILSVWYVAHGIWNMDPGRDGILYRITPGRPKQD
ncbi:unnamed protein product [Dibothriocephalus latus]|uniref:PH domain-containing protein n=1 Tax=Dibothriocephalus latus TaxID=60516 RepID=A0A3P6TNJ6_DIBLA|nr:unnamed protein product [Dibothriocephalus latus]